MTPEEADRIRSALAEHPSEYLLELVRVFNIQDPAEDRDSLLEQLVPILAFDERMQNLRAYFDHGEDVLLAVRAEDGSETFGWLVRVERETGCMILAPIERGAPETMRIVFDWNTRWRMCDPPSANKEPELNLF